MVEAKPQDKNINTTRMVNHIVYNVEVKIIGQIFLMVSTKISKGKCTPNLKVRKENKKSIVTRLRSYSFPYIKSTVTQIKNMAMMIVSNTKHLNQIIYI